MKNIFKKYPKHACQFCGGESKYVETIIDDEFFLDDDNKEYQPDGFTNIFEHTGNNRCASCKKAWSGL